MKDPVTNTYPDGSRTLGGANASANNSLFVLYRLLRFYYLDVFSAAYFNFPFVEQVLITGQAFE